LCQIDRAHQAERDGDDHCDNRTDENGAPEQGNRAKSGFAPGSGHSLGIPFGTEQKIDRRNHGEKPGGFKNQRKENADGGNNRDQRCEQQQQHRHTLDLCPRPQLGLDLEPGIDAARKNQKQRRDRTDHLIISDGIAIGFDHRLGKRVERIDLIAIGDGARFRQDCRPGKAVLRQLSGGRTGQRSVGNQRRTDKAPDDHEKGCRNNGPQGDIPAMIAGQGMQHRARILATGLQAGRLEATKEPGHQAQTNYEKKERRACHYIWFRPCFRIICKDRADNGTII